MARNVAYYVEQPENGHTRRTSSSLEIMQIYFTNLYYKVYKLITPNNNLLNFVSALGLLPLKLISSHHQLNVIIKSRFVPHLSLLSSLKRPSTGYER
jgi:hypothetical protein